MNKRWPTSENQAKYKLSETNTWKAACQSLLQSIECSNLPAASASGSDKTFIFVNLPL
jgi:hypothetical protein